MAIKRNKRFHAEVATSSLSDIMFFLLLFFLDYINIGKSECDQNDVAKVENKRKNK